jgi:flagellar hook assembly protein FlgD
VFSVPGGNGEAIRVSLRVYDVRGRLVAELVDGNLPAGTHEVVWEGRDLNGTLLASGTYFSRLTCGRETSVRKMLMLK